MTAENLSRFDDFPPQFRGPVLRPGGAAYSQARRIYNMRRAEDQPSLIARCVNENDVVLAVRYAAEKGFPVALRSGGHGVDGTSMPHDQLVIDLSLLKSSTVDARGRKMRVGSGILLGELDAASQQHGLVVPAGTVSTTGVAGLTLGGGIGYNMRRFGASVDSLLSCDVVTTTGRQVRASETENPDLFWALRGGGGNFGVVTSFEFRAHLLGTNVMSGVVAYPAEQAADVLQKLREHSPRTPRELTVIGALTQCPPLPTVAPENYGQPMLLLVVVYTGSAKDAEAVLAPLSRFGTPLASLVGPSTWVQTNSMLDVIAPYGRRVYTRGGYMRTFSDDAIARAVSQWLCAPPPATPGPCTVQNFWFMGAGAIHDDFAEDSAAFSREGVDWFWECVSQWDDPASDAQFEAWTIASHDALRPSMRANGYVNLTSDQGPEWLRGVYGSPAKYQRLLEAKEKWDPNNLLRFNKNFKRQS